VLKKVVLVFAQGRISTTFFSAEEAINEAQIMGISSSRIVVGDVFELGS
jgi:hypothetical protein